MNNNKLTNVAMKVSRNYVNSMSVDQLRALADFDANMVCHPSVAATGSIMEPAIQGPNYKPVYGYIPNNTYFDRIGDDTNAYNKSNDEYADAFREGYGRAPRDRNENLVFVGNPNDPVKKQRNRLAVLNDKDYETWAYNQTPMIADVMNFGEGNSTIGVQMALSNPYRIEYGPDGKQARVGLNPKSTATAYCSHCGKLFNLDENVNKGDKIEGYMSSGDRALHFCSMKCRSAYRDSHNYTPAQMREACTHRDERVQKQMKKSTNRGYYDTHRTNY